MSDSEEMFYEWFELKCHSIFNSGYEAGFAARKSQSEKEIGEAVAKINELTKTTNKIAKNLQEINEEY